MSGYGKFKLDASGGKAMSKAEIWPNPLLSRGCQMDPTEDGTFLHCCVQEGNTEL